MGAVIVITTRRSAELKVGDNIFLIRSWRFVASNTTNSYCYFISTQQFTSNDTKVS